MQSLGWRQRKPVVAGYAPYEDPTRRVETGGGCRCHLRSNRTGAITEPVWHPHSRQATTIRHDRGRAGLQRARPPALYSIIRNPALSRALRIIQKQGRDGFYRGEIADAIVAKVTKNGGVMTKKDIEEFSLHARPQSARGDVR